MSAFVYCFNEDIVYEPQADLVALNNDYIYHIFDAFLGKEGIDIAPYGYEFLLDIPYLDDCRRRDQVLTCSCYLYELTVLEHKSDLLFC